MKITNYQALILLELEETEADKGIWRPKLVEQLNSYRTTVFDNLVKLQKKKLVDKYKFNNGLQGRNRILWFATILGKKAIQIIQEGMKS
nr:MAG: DNA-binding protein, wHTH [uncultured archaeon]